MTFRGTVNNGRVDLDAGSDLPNGARVDVLLAKDESLLDFFKRNAVRDPSLPKDYASELDHYMYGHPKQSGTKSRKAGTRKSASKSATKKPTKKSRIRR